MNILIISSDLNKTNGGVKDHTEILYSNISEEKNTFKIYIKGNSFLSLLKITTFMKKNNIRYLILQYTPNLYKWYSIFPILILLYCKIKNINSLVIFHEIFLPEYTNLREKIFNKHFNLIKDVICLKTAKFCAVTTKKRINYIKENYNTSPFLLPVFSNIPDFKDKVSNQKEYLIGTFGTYHHDFDPLPIYAAMYYYKNQKAVFIGDLRAPFRQNIKITGYVDHKRATEILIKIKYFVLCDKRGISFRKGSTAAAFANNIPVIATHSDWTDNDFIHKKNVYFFDGSIEGLIGAVIDLENNPELSKQISSNAKILYNKYMSPKVITKKILNIFENK